MIEASAPGKLYIAGEYAVVEPGYPAVLTAVDQFITVSLEHAEQDGSIRSFQYGDFPIRWHRKNGKLVLDKRESTFHYITAAIDLIEQYAVEQNIPLSFYHLTVESELDSDSGLKYGLGSSAAVTVATIRALCRFYKIEETDELVFKLASLAHLSLDSNGSFGDVAASVYTGWLAYTSFDRKWVRNHWEKMSVTELLKTNWPHLSVQPLTPPENLRFVIGWTGSPASTTQLVDEVQNKRNSQLVDYQNFLNESKACVEQIVAGFTEHNLEKIQSGVRTNRELFKQLSQLSGVLIETPQLTALCDLAEEYGGAAKSSGAGGGDCGIAIFDRSIHLESLFKRWKEESIETLPLRVFNKNR